jgi:hypothetical protein
VPAIVLPHSTQDSGLFQRPNRVNHGFRVTSDLSNQIRSAADAVFVDAYHDRQRMLSSHQDGRYGCIDPFGVPFSMPPHRS